MRRALADWNLNGNGCGIERECDILQHAIEIGSLSIELIDEHNPRNLVLVRLDAKQFRFGLRPLRGH